MTLCFHLRQNVIASDPSPLLGNKHFPLCVLEKKEKTYVLWKTLVTIPVNKYIWNRCF